MEGGDSEGYISDVLVEGYGEGHISGIHYENMPMQYTEFFLL